MVTKASAWRLSSLTPASSRACLRLRCATIAQFNSGSVLNVPTISTERFLTCCVKRTVSVLRSSCGKARICFTRSEFALRSVPRTIDHKDRALADAGVLQAAQHRVQRNHRRQHAREIVVDIFEWYGHYER